MTLKKNPYEQTNKQKIRPYCSLSDRGDHPACFFFFVPWRRNAQSRGEDSGDC